MRWVYELTPLRAIRKFMFGVSRSHTKVGSAGFLAGESAARLLAPPKAGGARGLARLAGKKTCATTSVRTDACSQPDFIHGRGFGLRGGRIDRLAAKSEGISAQRPHPVRGKGRAHL